MAWGLPATGSEGGALDGALVLGGGNPGVCRGGAPVLLQHDVSDWMKLAR